jgi:hypothetical protein
MADAPVCLIAVNVHTRTDTLSDEAKTALRGAAAG